ncbi:hypothetical protein ABMA70_07650 [Halobacteriovorax sp. XZX-3]|uniref:hypothetical protein n=1 Tax=unclassified Halobacteriovorax TaxID=2639665 RepID=UPI00371B584C
MKLLIISILFANTVYSKCVIRNIDNVKSERSTYFKGKVISSNSDKGMADVYTLRDKQSFPSYFEMKVKVEKVYKGNLKYEELHYKYPWIWNRLPGTKVFKKDEVLILSLKELPETNVVTEGYGQCGQNNKWFYFSKASEMKVEKAVQVTSLVAPSDYKVIKPYLVNSSQRRCANYSKSLAVDINSNKLHINEYQGKVSRSSSLLVSNGEFRAENHGEWGGGLKFVSKVKKMELYDNNISFVFEYGEKVLALGGLAHLRMDSGILIEVVKIGDSWKVVKKHKLGSKPNSYTVIEDKVYIVTNKGISVFRKGSVEKVWESNYLDLYPNSLVVLDDVFYIGMRHAVARVYKNESNKLMEDWLVRKECISIKGLKPVYK